MFFFTNEQSIVKQDFRIETYEIEINEVMFIM